MTTGRILVVDDDAAIRTVVREALRREGHVVETAASVAEQRRALASFAPDVLITDVVLPDGSTTTLGSDSAHQTGFDLLGAFIGSEGPLGVVTSITVRLLPRPSAPPSRARSNICLSHSTLPSSPVPSPPH